MGIPFVGKREQINYGNALIVVGGRLETYPIESESEGILSFGNYLLPITEGEEYFSTDGERTIVYNLTLPALIEAETLYKIRESQVLKGLFDSLPDPKKFLDFLPMIILGLITLVALFVRK